MNRRVVGAVIGAVGALVVVTSAFLPWYDGLRPTEIPLAQLVQAGDAGTTPEFWGSIAAVLAAVGILVLLGAVVRSRFLIALGWLVGVGAVGLLWVMFTIGDRFGPDDPGTGVVVCIAGLVVLLIGLVVMGARQDSVEARLSMFDSDPPQ